MKKIIFFSFLVLAMLSNATRLLAQANGKCLIVNTTSRAEMDKIVASLKGVPSSAYHYTITTHVNGRTSTRSYGTAPLSSVAKLQGRSNSGGAAADGFSDIIVIVKVGGKLGDLQSKIISQIDERLTNHLVVPVRISANNRRIAVAQ